MKFDTSNSRKSAQCLNLTTGTLTHISEVELDLGNLIWYETLIYKVCVCARAYKHMPLFIYLAWLQAINNSRLIFKHIKNKDALPMVKTLTTTKKVSGHINQQLLISSHFNQLPKIIIKNSYLKKCISKLLFQPKRTSILFLQNCYLQKCMPKLLSQRYFILMLLSMQ